MPPKVIALFFVINGGFFLSGDNGDRVGEIDFIGLLIDCSFSS